MRKKSKIDWSLTPCCGAKRKRISGIWCCSLCKRPAPLMIDHKSAETGFDRHDKAYAKGEDE